MNSGEKDSGLHEVIMPALGMTQDTGEIIAWHKQVGDAVMPDDVLMEVETDKTTMEVEAGFTGFVTDIRAAAGTSVPVGDVIAVLSDSIDGGVPHIATVQAIEEIPDSDSPPETLPQSTDAKAEVESAEPAVVTAPKSSTHSASTTGSPKVKHHAAATGLVLASPKAKLAAHEQGVNLTRLMRRGVEQPVQHADLEAYVATTVGSLNARSQLQARVARLQFTQLTSWALEVSEGSVTAGSVWCMFGAAAFRQARILEVNDDVTVCFESWLNRDLDLACLNADATGLMDVVPMGDLDTPDLLIRDMTGTRLVGYQRAEPEAGISLSVIDEGAESLLLSLDFDEEELSLSGALVLLQRLGERVEQPLRHLL